jgi:hypothetical protein
MVDLATRLHSFLASEGATGRERKGAAVLEKLLRARG